MLAFLALLKRSVSSVVACRNTLRVIAERYGTLQSEAADRHELRRQRLRTLRDYRRRLERYGILSSEEEQDQARLEAEDMAHELLEGGAEELVDKLKTLEREGQRTRDHSRRVDKTLTALQGLVRLAEQAIDEDPKPPALLGQIEDIRGTEPRANILVYTEYTDSQEVAVGFLSEAKTKGRLKGEIIAIKGDDGEKARTAAATRFATEDGLILVSTDAMSEGLNLHQRCHYLIHLELPYNPNRLEQRNGRIDRYGQRETPRVQYLYLAGTFEERLLLRLVAKYERQRARLTFVPNTLGLLTSETGLITVKLLEGLAEEQGCLFTRPPTQLKMLEGNEDEDTGSPAYQELLAEVERAMSGFEKASKSRDWLSEAGLNAEQSRLDAATEALDESRELLAPIDLIAFVRQVIEADAGLSNALSEEPDGALRLKLSRDWMYGLDDLPGYDAEQRVLRLTRDRARQTDDEDRPLGYIGRAHPIVRRALDRVRHFQAGTGDALLDRRVSAVRGEAGQPPTLVYTYLCAVRSDDDAEYERVIAVRFSEREGPLALTEPAAWLAQAAPERQVPTRGVWERHFARWATPASDAASDAAQQAFAPLGEVVIRARYEELDRERREIDAWFRTRVDDLCGKAVAVTGDLFTPVESSGSRWQSLTEPKERVATVASDRANPSARRREAEGVLTLYERRIEDLSRRKRLRIEAPSPLGLLMLVPAEDHG